MAFRNVQAFRTIARETRATLGFTTLLSDPTDNPKLAKGIGLGILSVPLHLAPHTLSGHNVCAMASPGCSAACLHTAGRTFTQGLKDRARIARTRLYFSDRETFMTLLVGELAAHVARARLRNMLPAIRLNATSDIKWERVPVRFAGVVYPNVMALFPDVQFYDYTKIAKRALSFARGAAGWPSNYHLTFSLTESNDLDARRVLEAGGNVAVVFNVRRTWALPARYSLAGFAARVVDADQHDFRPSDGAGVVAGLRAKGKAILDESGFVRHVRVRRKAMRLAKAA